MSSNRNAASEPHSRERSNNAYHTQPSCLKICLSSIGLPTDFIAYETLDKSEVFFFIQFSKGN